MESSEENPFGDAPEGVTETPGQRGKSRRQAPPTASGARRGLFDPTPPPQTSRPTRVDVPPSEQEGEEQPPSLPKKPLSSAPSGPRVQVLSSEEEAEEPRPTQKSSFWPFGSKAKAAPKKAAVIPPAATVPPPPMAAKPSAEEKAVREMAHAITDVVMRALQPMWDAVCGLAWKLGYRDARYFLVYRDAKTTDATDPFAYLRVIDENDPKLTTMAYFVSKYSPILGQRFLTLFLAQYQKGEEKQARETLAKKPKTIDACFDVDVDLANLHAPHLHRQFDSSALAELKRQLQLFRSSVPPPQQVRALDPMQVEEQIARLESGQEALKLLRLQETEARFAPAWAFQVLSDNVFRTFVAPAGLAAFEMALAHVRRIPGCSTFEMKELICSAEVKDQFMWLAAYQYLDASKGLPMDRPASGKGERNVYVNYNAMRETLQRRAYLCSIWFESVVATQNPLVEQFRKYRATLPGLLSQDEIETLAMYEASLPQRELKYVGC